MYIFNRIRIPKIDIDMSINDVDADDESMVTTMNLICELLLQGECTIRHAYEVAAQMEHMVNIVANSLCTQVTPYPWKQGLVSSTGTGRLIYIGIDGAGLLGLIDASECVPTCMQYINMYYN